MAQSTINRFFKPVAYSPEPAHQVRTHENDGNGNETVDLDDEPGSNQKTCKHPRSIIGNAIRKRQQQDDFRPVESISIKRRKASKLTPLDQQFKELKQQNMDKILVIRVGYKYKCFAQDAAIVSNILHIKLVPGKLSLDDSNTHDEEHKQFAYCSFPDVRLNIHLERLIRKNLKVAVVEQAETSSIKKHSTDGTKNEVFKREIKSVFTRATFPINDTFAKDSKRIIGDINSIWALFTRFDSERQLNVFWLLSINLTNGSIIYDCFTELLNVTNAMLSRIKHLDPIEVIAEVEIPHAHLRLLQSSEISFKYAKSIDSQLTCEQDEALSSISKNLKLSKEFSSLMRILYGYLVEFGNEYAVLIESNYKPFETNLCLSLDAVTLENLDIFHNDGSKGSLLWVLDHTRTAFGFRLLREWLMKPLVEKEQIENRLDAIDCLTANVSDIFFDALNTLLKNTPDLLRTLNRITYGKTARKEVYFFLKNLCVLGDHFKLHRSYILDQIYNKEGKISKSSVLLSTVVQSMNEYFQTFKVHQLLSVINVSAVLSSDVETQVTEFFNLNNYEASSEIIRLQCDIESVKQELHQELRSIRTLLKRPTLQYKNDTEYLIELRNTQSRSLPSDWVKVNGTKMVSRFTTPRLQTLVEKLQYRKDLLYQEADNQYAAFLYHLKGEYANMKNIINYLAIYDCLLSLSATACNLNYNRPMFTNEDSMIESIKARNAIIESLDVDYVPNDIHMSKTDGKVLVITGPNMGGKSSYIRKVALLVIMAQIGSYVPAESFKCSIFDNILTRIGASDNILQRESTFKKELLEIKNILSRSSPSSLVLLDEVGRGTSTKDGEAISYALLKYFMDLPQGPPLILFTTHIPALGTIQSPFLKNYHMDFLEEIRAGESWKSVIFLYKLKAGATSNSYGLNVAKLAGLDTDIIDHANTIAEKSKHNSEILESLKFPLQLSSIIIRHRTDNYSNASTLDALIKLIDNFI